MKNIIKKELFWIFLILILTFISYYKILNFDFVYWDDDKQIFNNQYVTNLNSENIKHNFFYERFTFIPLTLYSLLFQIVGKNAFYFHLFSIIFHLINVLLFYNLIKRLNLNSFFNILSTIIFALHPLRIESVAWISEWKDLLFTLFSLLGILFYLNWLDKNNTFYIFLYSISTLFASYSKVQGLLLPFSVILIDTFIHKRLRYNFIFYNLLLLFFILFFYKKIVQKMFILLLFIPILLKKFKISYQLNKYHFIAILALCILAAFYAFTKKIVWFWEKDNIIPFTDKIMYSSYALTFYLKQFFLPIKQIAIHPYPDISGKELFLKWWFYIFSWIFTLIAAFKFYTKKYFLELFGLAFFILNISIVLHFISIEGRLIVAERYPYLAYSGLIITTSSLISRYLNNRILKNCVISIISIIFSILISIRTDIWKNTETLFYDVLNKNPKISFAWQNLGSYYLEKKQYNKAYKCYEIAIKLEPNNTQYILNKSFAALALNNKEMAIKLLNEVISKSKSDEEISFAILTLGQIEANTGNTNKANYYYTLAIKKYPKNYKAYLQKSFLFSYPGNIVNIDSAIYYANKAVEYNINYADAYNTLSWLYLLKNNILLSKQYALKSIRANRYYSLGYNTLGYIYQTEKKYDSAFYMYQLALNIDSNLLEVRRNRAWIYFQNNNFKNALIDYNYILKHNPNDWIALTNRAFCYIKLNQFNNAILDFKHILKLFPDSAESYYNLGWSFLQTNLLDSALNYYNEAIKINPQYYRAVLDRGIIYFKKNNLNEALKDFSKLKYINPTNGEVYFWIAKVYEKKSDVYNACLNYKTAYNKGFLEAKNFLNLCEKYIVGNEK